MNNCKNLRLKSKNYKKYLYCNILKKQISFEDCKTCKYKEYKNYKNLKKYTYKQQKKENNRFSILYKDLTICCLCGKTNGEYDARIGQPTFIAKNEVYEGAYRNRSISYGMINPLCIYCHKLYDEDRNLNLDIKIQFQKEFMKSHTIEEFINIFGQNYIYKKEKKTRM